MFYSFFAEYIPLLSYAFIRSFVIFIIALGIVYILGRMLEIVNSDRGRNAVAIIVIFVCSYWSILIYDMDIVINELEIYWRTLTYATGSCILFVLIGWKLFDRIDNLLDKKIAPDENETNNKKRGRKRGK